MASPSTKQKVTNGSGLRANGEVMSKRSSMSVRSKAKAKDNIEMEARKQAKKIKGAIEEANEIHTGRKKAKSFDKFIKEL